MTKRNEWARPVFVLIEVDKKNVNPMPRPGKGRLGTVKFMVEDSLRL